jgi:predicted O-methyltransferase YrrM
MNKQYYSFLHQLQQSKQKQDFWNISWPQALLLGKIISTLKPNSVLELGTSNGFSSIAMFLEYTIPKFVSLEIDKQRYDIAQKHFTSLSLPITLHHCNALDYLDSFSDDPFDFVFIDALQQEYATVVSLLLDRNVICKGSYILFDNVESHKSMEKLPYFLEQLGFALERFSVGSGFLLAQLQ